MSDLEELKSLLFGAEKQTLESLNERVREPKTRATDIADVLPKAIQLSYNNDPALITELRDPVTSCLKESFKHEPEEYADVLYPIMGPAIRKSIAQALKAFTQQINQTMDNSLSAKGIAWRFQAYRAGIPFSDFVMQRSLQYRIEQAYLISRENGLLMAHVHHDATKIKDSDAVSAMFTAIQDFVKESFSPDPNSRLETADIGEFTLWAVHGPHALMVCVIRGLPPKALRTELSAILERIHFRFSDALRSYAGDPKTVSGVETELQAALEFEAQHKIVDEGKLGGAQILLIILLLCIVAGLGYTAYERWQRHQYIADITDRFSKAPGVYLGNIDYDKGVFLIQGLRDPMAASIESITSDADIGKSQIKASFLPYQSLEPSIVFSRMKAQLDPPAGVNLALSDDAISVTGQAPQHWIEQLHTMIAAGSIGLPVFTENLVSIDQLQFDAALAKASGKRFLFSTNEKLTIQDTDRLQIVTRELKGLANTAEKLDIELQLSIVEATDIEHDSDKPSWQLNAVVSELLAVGFYQQQMTVERRPVNPTSDDAQRVHQGVLIFLTQKQK